MRDEVTGLDAEISETASQIRSEVSDSVNGLNSTITETASQIRSEVADSVNGLNSSITQTASQIRSEVSDSVNGLNSSITQTASQIRSEVADSVNGLNSSITQTASQIRSEVSDSVNGLNSSITQTASQIRAEVRDSVNGLNSSITQTASQIRAEVSDTKNGLNSSITQTASQIRAEVRDSVNGLSSSITQTASQIRAEVSDTKNGLKTTITQTASQLRAELSDAKNGFNSSITSTASQLRSEVNDTVNGVRSAFTQEASQIRQEITSATSAASIVAKINKAGSNVTISADTIDLNGLITAMQTHHIKVESINCTDWMNIGDDIYYVSPGHAYSNLSHGHTLSADSNGNVTLGSVTWDTSKMSFNMADTAWYAGRVSAIWLDASNTVDLLGRRNGSGSFTSIKGQSYASGISLSFGDYYEVKTVYKTGPNNPNSAITRTITAPSLSLSSEWNATGLNSVGYENTLHIYNGYSQVYTKAIYLSSYGNSTIVARENSASGSVIARIDSKYNAGWDASVQNVDIQRSFVSNNSFSSWSSVEDDVIYLKNPDDYYAFAARYMDSSGNWQRKVTYVGHSFIKATGSARQWQYYDESREQWMNFNNGYLTQLYYANG